MDIKKTQKTADIKDFEEAKEDDTEREIKPEDAKAVAGGTASVEYE